MFTCTCSIDRPGVYCLMISVMHVTDAAASLEGKSVNGEIRTLVRSVKVDKLQSRWLGCHDKIPYSFTHTVFIHLVQHSLSPDGSLYTHTFLERTESKD